MGSLTLVSTQAPHALQWGVGNTRRLCQGYAGCTIHYSRPLNCFNLSTFQGILRTIDMESRLMFCTLGRNNSPLFDENLRTSAKQSQYD
jgi:hypothetical protein